MQKFTDEELDKELAFFLGHCIGREQAIDRWTLVIKIFGEGADFPRNDGNLQDRAIRECVSRLRIRDGLFICDMADGRGRFIAITEEDYRQFRKSYLKPLVSRADVIRAMDKHAVKKWPNLLQPALFDMRTLEVEL